MPAGPASADRDREPRPDASIAHRNPAAAAPAYLIWNLACLPFSTMIEIPWGKFPPVDGHEHARRWLQFYANIGRAQNTIVAYGRALDDHLRFLAEANTVPLVAGADVVAAWTGDMLS